MTKRFIGAFVFAAALSLDLAAADPPGATCYHFPLITVCCDAGGCYILR